MSIIALPALNDNYIWTITNELNHSMSCIDPGNAEPVLAYAKRHHLSLDHILITHHHADHTAGIADLLQSFPKVIIYGPADSRIPQVNRVVRDEDIVDIDTLAFRVLDTPGHTQSHLCYQEPSKGLLFCGDTLFSAGCGRIFEGSIEQLHQSILLLKNLPNDTKVYCAHEYTKQNLAFATSVEPDNHTIHDYLAYLQKNPDSCTLPSTIALEKRINPFMRTDSPSVQQFARAQGLNSTDSLAIFKLLREKKDVFQS